MTEENNYLKKRQEQKLNGKPEKKKKIYNLKRTPIKKKFYRVKKVSEKREKENEVYRPISEAFRRDHPVCAIKSPVCTRETQGVHHVQGRVGKDFLDKSKMLPSCNACNQYIESHSKWAKENGFKKPNYKSKLTKLK